MAVIPHAIGKTNLYYKLNAGQQIEASSRRRRRSVAAGERFGSCSAIAQNETCGGGGDFVRCVFGVLVTSRSSVVEAIAFLWRCDHAGMCAFGLAVE